MYCSLSPFFISASCSSNYIIISCRSTISCRSRILADVNITSKKLLTENTWMLIEEIHSFYYKEKCCGLFLAVAYTRHGNIMSRILVNSHFDFPATFLIAKIAYSHLC